MPLPNNSDTVTTSFNKCNVGETVNLKEVVPGNDKSVVTGQVLGRKRNMYSEIVDHRPQPSKKKTLTTICNCDTKAVNKDYVDELESSVNQQNIFLGLQEDSCKEKHSTCSFNVSNHQVESADSSEINISSGEIQFKQKVKQEINLPDARFSGNLYNFRCIICNVIPSKPNRSELYRHYSQQHFADQLFLEFGHLKKCPFCDLDMKKKQQVARHFGQKHNFVEKFLPENARIIKSSTSPNISLGSKKRNKVNSYRNKTQSTSKNKEHLNVNIIDGFEVEFSREKDETSNATITNNDNNNYADVKVKCNICKEMMFGTFAVAQHVKFDHLMKATTANTAVDHLEAVLRSGHITLTSEKESCGGGAAAQQRKSQPSAGQ